MRGRIVFRGSGLHPLHTFMSGFTPRIARGEIQIQPGGQMIGGVSTSKDLGTAMRYAAAYEGWVYVAYLTSGIDVLEYLVGKASSWFGGDTWRGGIPNAVSQAEIAAVSIAGDQLIAARKCRVNGEIVEMYGLVLPNPRCRVPESQRAAGRAWLDSGVTASREYAH